MKKIKVLFNRSPDVTVRVILSDDKETVKRSKQEYPFKLSNNVVITIVTDTLKFSFRIKEGFVWNGADIPPFLWQIIGSRTDNSFLVASMVHDFMLKYKKFLIEDVLKNSLTIEEYRNLTTNVFCELLTQSGTGKVKAKLMSGCVGWYQNWFNRRGWKL